MAKQRGMHILRTVKLQDFECLPAIYSSQYLCQVQSVILQGNESDTNQKDFDKARFSYFLSKGVTMSMRGSKCFDASHYAASNPDLPSEASTWEHFTTQGQFEGRPFRQASGCSTVNISMPQRWVPMSNSSMPCSALVTNYHAYCRFACENGFSYPSDDVLKSALILAQNSMGKAAFTAPVSKQ